ncbi:hypothetical protein FQR65_LT19985 [Abscondita terminalis]|nr:hypothetical protein FQR65_LT19985 [Abscondita terminalis]
MGDEGRALILGGELRLVKMAVAAFLADRTVMRVVGHQPFDDAGAKGFGFLVVDGDPGVVGGGGHARHDDTPACVVLVVVLLDRALAAGPTLPRFGVANRNRIPRPKEDMPL